ncbi:hypothetical protein BIZ37_13225 [Photobacterium sp. BZF1]|uniref:hypothetical protein n=1 Tax=Photobacterium sp. BZF1 TaxID=1904457 RepID=UPI001653EAD0|nr:hypothetical protein [Photobacterium sp. BZF1]MBC7003522.1 hypothetical protein [Photobacterium sp. BZF1]
MDKIQLLEFLHTLVSHNVISQNAYKCRYDGFNGELDFICWLKKHRPSIKYASGGTFIPLVKTDNSFEDSVYFTVAPREESFVECQLEKVSLLSLKGQYLFTYDPYEPWSSWSNFSISSESGSIEFSIPSSFSVQKYNSHKHEFELSDIEQFLLQVGFSPYFRCTVDIPDGLKQKYIEKLSSYSTEELLSLYLTRFVFDGLCGLGNGRGAPLDIDFFVQRKTGGWCILEVKEKDKSKRKDPPPGFGMDVRRIKSLLELESKLDLSAYYLVRHINDQKSRNFIDWRIINMKKFDARASKLPVQGGVGMGRSGSDNPTRICEFSEFAKLY